MHLNATPEFADARREQLQSEAASQRLSVLAACSRRWGLLTRRRVAE